MKNNRNMSRRGFIKKGAVATGAGIVGGSTLNFSSAETRESAEKRGRLPREVWVASVSAKGLGIDGTKERKINTILSRMEQTLPYQPDIICLPEAFVYQWSRKPSLSEKAEEVPGPTTSIIAEFARKHNCYVICPLHTKEGGRFYNTAVLIGRKGEIVGKYHKLYPVSSEIKGGITPGPAKVPVFDTDFGKIGIQICFDANWHEGFRSLSDSGAEIVFFSSAFDGGRILNLLAWDHEVYIVSSLWDTPGRIIDITGDELYKSGRYPIKHVCGPINLDKKVFHGNHMKKIYEIEAKYGRKLIIKILEDEGCLTIESNSPDVTVAQVMEEFDLITYRQYLKNETEFIEKHRL